MLVGGNSQQIPTDSLDFTRLIFVSSDDVRRCVGIVWAGLSWTDDEEGGYKVREIDALLLSETALKASERQKLP